MPVTHPPAAAGRATLPTRLAGPHDAAELVRLRRLMFTSMDLPVHGSDWESEAGRWFRAALDGPDALAVVVDDPDRPGRLAASAVAELLTRIPGPSQPHGRWAYVSTVSTDEAHRRRGLSRAVCTRLLAELRARGAERVELHASPDGRALYEALGFVDRPGAPEMRLAGWHGAESSAP